MKDNKEYVLITGATSGIGAEFAKLFAGSGYKLILVSRDEKKLNEIADQFSIGGTEVEVFVKDLSIRDEVFSLCREIAERGYIVDVLVNDAGHGLYGKFSETELEEELDMIDLNVSAVVILTKKFLKEMVARGSGKILNLASIASKTPGPWQSVYHATKAFVLSFSEAIREEVKDQGITITALMPGATDTNFFARADMLDSKIIQDKDSLADPADVARDGFDALMSGKDKVISGIKNKIQVGLENLMPDKMAAHQTAESQKPVNN